MYLNKPAAKSRFRVNFENIFKNTFFTEHLRVTASEKHRSDTFILKLEQINSLLTKV